MVHLVSKDSDIVKEQETIRDFSKELVQEPDGSEDKSQNIDNSPYARLTK